MIKQAGLTLWGLLAVSALVVFFMLLGFKLFPAYFDDMKIQEALDTLVDEHRVTSMDKRTMIRRLDDILYIDFGHEIVDLKETLVVEKTKQSLVLRIDYERVIPLAFNISALLDFKNSVEVDTGL